MRGTGSLQELLGRSVGAQKPKPKPQKVIPLPNSEPAAPEQPSEPRPEAGREASPLRHGNVRCPVCTVQLENDPECINTHIDKCLGQASTKRSRQQTTLLQYAKLPRCSSAPPPQPPAEPLAARTLALAAAPGSAAAPAAAAGPPPLLLHASPCDSSHEAAQPLSAGLQRTSLRHQLPAAPQQQQTQLRRFPCCIVGRRYQQDAGSLPEGLRVVVELEVGNPRDPNALLVLDAQSRHPLGHLPRAVAQQLGPLLRKEQVLVEGEVQEGALTERGPVALELQVTLASPTPASSPGRLASTLDRAEAAAAAQLQQVPQATGERLAANFLTILDTVERHDGHLLGEEERSFMAAYKALSPPCQCLFLRLVQRKGPLFRLAALNYAEVPDAALAGAQLEASGLAGVLKAAGELEVAWQQVADLLTVPELLAVLAEAAGGRGGSGGRLPVPSGRQQLLGVLDQQAQLSAAARSHLQAALLAATGTLLCLSAAALAAVHRLQRLFFMNEGQNLSQFLVADLGAVRYPEYQVERTCSAFSERQQLIDYEKALEHAMQLTDALELGDTEAAEAVLQHVWAALDSGMHKHTADSGGGGLEMPPFLRRFHAGWVFCMMGTAGVSLLERRRQYQAANERLQQLLGGTCCPSRRGEWWVRLSINTEHLGRPVEALELAEAALADGGLADGDRLALQRRVLRLGKPPRRWKKPPWADAAQWEPPEVRIEGRPLNNTVGMKSRFYGLNDEQCSVEELALQYYASEEGGGWQGAHSEGGIWATLFGLLFWEVLFQPLPDVFRTRFQTAPLDLDTDAFLPARKNAAEACLTRIAAGNAPTMLQHTWEQQYGTLCRGITWDRQSLPDLQLIASCVGGPGLAAVCRLLAADHGGWGSGMPDLLLWHPEQGCAKLSEVKGPRDRLSDQQRAWMAALTAAGLQAEVLKVLEPSIGKRRKTA